MDNSSGSGRTDASNKQSQDELMGEDLQLGDGGNNADIRMPSGTDDPLSDAEIQKYREEINRMDRTILEAIKRRTKVSQAIGKTRMGSGGTRDRKSTRLNSSHVAISYAVFCVKKKT